MERKSADTAPVHDRSLASFIVTAAPKTKKGTKGSPVTGKSKVAAPAAPAWGGKSLGSTPAVAQAPVAAGAGVSTRTLDLSEIPSTPAKHPGPATKHGVTDPVVPTGSKPASLPTTPALPPPAAWNKPTGIKTPGTHATDATTAVLSETKAAAPHTPPTSVSKSTAPSRGAPVASPATPSSDAADWPAGLSQRCSREEAREFMGREVAKLRISSKKERAYCSTQRLKAGMSTCTSVMQRFHLREFDVPGWIAVKDLDKQISLLLSAMLEINPFMTLQQMEEGIVDCIKSATHKTFEDLNMGNLGDHPLVKERFGSKGPLSHFDQVVTTSDITRAILEMDEASRPTFSRGKVQVKTSWDDIFNSIAARRGIKQTALRLPAKDRLPRSVAFYIQCTRRSGSSVKNQLGDISTQVQAEIFREKEPEVRKAAAAIVQPTLRKLFAQHSMRNLLAMLLTQCGEFDLIHKVVKKMAHLSTAHKTNFNIWLDTTASRVDDLIPAKKRSTLVRLSILFLDACIRSMADSASCVEEGTEMVALPYTPLPIDVSFDDALRGVLDKFAPLIGWNLATAESAAAGNHDDGTEMDPPADEEIEQAMLRALSNAGEDLLPRNFVLQSCEAALLQQFGAKSLRQFGIHSIEDILDGCGEAVQTALDDAVNNLAAKAGRRGLAGLGPAQLSSMFRAVVRVLAAGDNRSFSTPQSVVDILNMVTNEQMQADLVSHLNWYLAALGTSLDFPSLKTLLKEAAKDTETELLLAETEAPASKVQHVVTSLAAFYAPPDSSYNVASAIGVSESEVIGMLEAIPVLRPISEYLLWSDIFQPQFGSLSDFLHSIHVVELCITRKLRFVEVEPSVFVRVPAVTSSVLSDITQFIIRSDIINAAGAITGWMAVDSLRKLSPLTQAVQTGLASIAKSKTLLATLLELVVALPRNLQGVFGLACFFDVCANFDISHAQVADHMLQDSPVGSRQFLLQLYATALKSTGTTEGHARDASFPQAAVCQQILSSALKQSSARTLDRAPASSALLSQFMAKAAEEDEDGGVYGEGDEEVMVDGECVTEDSISESKAPNSAESASSTSALLAAAAFASTDISGTRPTDALVAKAVVLELRKEWLDNRDSIAGKTAQAATRRLADELYKDSSHFVFEFLQNADDTVYADGALPQITFDLRRHSDEQLKLLVLTNELGFTSADVRSICQSGLSSKDKSKATGQIGKKGIGFKSVFSVTDLVHIHSGYLHFGFDIRPEGDGELGRLAPMQLDDDSRTEGTKFVFHLSERRDGRKSSSVAIRDGLHQISTMSPLLLFLRRVQCMVVQIADGAHPLNYEIKVLKRTPLSSGQSVAWVGVRNSSGMTEEIPWILYRTPLLQSVGLEQQVIDQAPSQYTPTNQAELVLAFPATYMVTVKKCMESGSSSYPQLADQPLFSFLPLTACNLKFVLQADWHLPSNREYITESNPWNEWLATEAFPNAFIQSFSTLTDFVNRLSEAGAGTDTVPTALLVSQSFLSFIPAPTNNSSLLQRGITRLYQLLGSLKCVATSSNELVSPSVAISIPDNVLTALRNVGIDTDFLRDNDLHAVSHKLVVNRAIWKALGVNEWTMEHATFILAKFIEVQQANGEDAGLIFAKACQLLFASDRVGTHSIGALLADHKFIPLSDGTCTSLSEGKISYIDARSNSPDSAIITALLAGLQGVVRTVLHTDTLSSEECIHRVAVYGRLGIKPLNLTLLVADHVLPWLQTVANSSANIPSSMLVKCSQAVAKWMQLSKGSMGNTEQAQLLKSLRESMLFYTACGHVVQYQADATSGQQTVRIVRCPSPLPHVCPQAGHILHAPSGFMTKDSTRQAFEAVSRTFSPLGRWAMLAPDYFAPGPLMKTDEWIPFLSWAGITSAYSGFPIQAATNTALQVASPPFVPHQVRSQATSAVDTKSIMTEFKLLLQFCVEGIHSSQSSEKIRHVDAIRTLGAALGRLVLDSPAVEKPVMCKQMEDFDDWVPSIEDNVWSCCRPTQLYFPCDAVISCFGNQVQYSVDSPAQGDKEALLAVFLPLGVRNEPDVEKALEIMHHLADPPAEEGQCHYWTRHIDDSRTKQHDRDQRVSVVFEKALAARLYKLLAQHLRSGAIQCSSLRLLLEVGEDRTGSLDLRRGRFVDWPDSQTLHSTKDVIAIWDDGIDGLMKRVGIYSLSSSGIYEDTEIAAQLSVLQPVLVAWAWVHALQRITPALADVDEFIVSLCSKLRWNTDQIDASALLRNAVMLHGFPVSCDVLLATPSHPETGKTIMSIAAGDALGDCVFLFAGKAGSRAEYLVNKCASIPAGPRARYPSRVILLNSSYSNAVQSMLMVMGLGYQYYNLEGRLEPLPLASAVQYSEVTIGDRKALAHYIEYLQRCLKTADPESYEALRDAGYGTRFAALLQREDAIQPVKDLTIDFILPRAPLQLVVERQACSYKMIANKSDSALQLYVDLGHLSDKAWLQAVVDFVAETALQHRELGPVRRLMGNFVNTLMKGNETEIDNIKRAMGQLDEGEEQWFGSSAISAAELAATEAEIQKLMEDTVSVAPAPTKALDISGAEIDAVVEDAKAMEEAILANMAARVTSVPVGAPVAGGQGDPSGFGSGVLGGAAVASSAPLSSALRSGEDTRSQAHPTAPTGHSSESVHESLHSGELPAREMDGSTSTSHAGHAHAPDASVKLSDGHREGGSGAYEGGPSRIGKTNNTYIMDDSWQDIDVDDEMALQLEWLPVLEDSITAASTGRAGESLAYRYLSSKYSSDSSATVTWKNKEDESFAPYDILVTFNQPSETPTHHYYEVKSALDSTRITFPISPAEVEFATTVVSPSVHFLMFISGLSESRPHIRIAINPMLNANGRADRAQEHVNLLVALPRQQPSQSVS